MSRSISSSRSRSRRPLAAALAVLACFAALLAAAAPASASMSAAASIAAANVGKSAGYCAVRPTSNTKGKQYATSCDGHLGTGQGEYWCADFGKWVWNAGGLVTTGLTAAAASFDSYGSTYNSFQTVPQAGDAVTFAYDQYGTSHHVGIITSVAGTKVTIANGDWGGTSGSGESYFARTSSVVSLTIDYSNVSRGSWVPKYSMYVSHIVGPLENA